MAKWNRLRNLERLTVYDGSRIRLYESLGGFSANDRSSCIAAFTQNRGPAGCAMGIGSQKVDAVMTKQNFGALLCGHAKFTRDAHCSYLNKYSLLDEPGHGCRMILDLPIALWMDKDRPDAFQLQLVKQSVGTDRNRELRKLHEHVISLIDLGDEVVFGLIHNVV